ncbi:MAG: FIST N-terminal domain-containing protein [Minisyncoccia bacterium]
MNIGQKLWRKESGWVDVSPQVFQMPPQLVLSFGARALVEDPVRFEEIRKMFPESHIISCSTAGEILGDRVRDDSIALTAIQFDTTTLSFAEADIDSAEDSFAVGKKLADSISKDKLVHAMIFSDGLRMNGTQLTKSLNENLPPAVSVTGGFAGDSTNFKRTAVGLDHAAQEGKVVLVGFSGDALKVGYGALGGWDSFGMDRVITKSSGNVLYELDGKPALDLYERYLGERAKGLPSTGLLFPLRLKLGSDTDTEVVRSVLAINESDRSLKFGGDMPEGATVTLMKASLENLIDDATEAGSQSTKSLGSDRAELAILISCIARKSVLQERVEEEIEAVRSAIGPQAAIIGFYSYGEISPTAVSRRQCLLHNQTMTVTVFRET